MTTADGLSPEARRLAWACRRGMLELDALLKTFLEKRFDQLEAAEQAKFERLLQYPDQLLYDWFMGKAGPADKSMDDVIQRVRAAALD